MAAIKPALFENLEGQLESAHDEISTLSKKNPDGKVNEFKLGYINSVLSEINKMLGKEGVPLKGFSEFDLVTLPSNSDIVFVLSQYINSMEQYRTANIKMKDNYTWEWVVDGKVSGIKTVAPRKLRK